MSRTTSLLVALVLTAGSVVSGAAEQPQIVGAWRFVSDVSTKDDGTVVPIAGPSEGYEALLIYTADGFVSANVTPKGRKWTDTSSLDHSFKRPYSRHLPRHTLVAIEWTP